MELSVLRSNGYLASLFNTDEDWVLERDYIYTLVNDTLVDGLIARPAPIVKEFIGNHRIGARGVFRWIL